jgi:hypothetical protein
VRSAIGVVDAPAGLAQQRLAAAHLDLDLAERLHDERVVRGALDAGVRDRAGSSW